MIGTNNMQPIYIKSFNERFKTRVITNYILSSNKNYSCNDEVRCIMYCYRYNLCVYIDKNIEAYFNLYPNKWPKLGSFISISKYLKLNGFILIEFNSLIKLIDVTNKQDQPHAVTITIYRDLLKVLQLVLAKWNDWN